MKKRSKSRKETKFVAFFSETKDGVIFFILTFWIVTLITATALIVASQRRKNASYVLPRLIQQAGLLIVGILTAFAITFYFFGSSSTINSYIMTLYKASELQSLITNAKFDSKSSN